MSDQAKSAIREAMKSTGLDDPSSELWKTDSPFSTEDDPNDALEVSEEDPSEAEPVVEEPEEVQEESVPAAEEHLSDEEVVASEGEYPDDYFGIKKGDTPDDVWVKMIDHMREADKTIQSEKRTNAELRKQGEKEPPVEEPTEETVEEGDFDPVQAVADISDDDLMKYYEYDPEDPAYDLQKDMLLPVLRRQAVMELQQEVEQQTNSVAAFQANWDATLDALEETHGKLPMDREAILDQALEWENLDPASVYSRIALEGQAKTQKFLDEAVKEVSKKPKPPTQTRPRGGSGEKAKDPNKKMSPRESAAAAAEELGMSWADALKNA